MPSPDPKQRSSFSWRIRWIAGLFSLLMVAAGIGPAAASAGWTEAPGPIPIEACRTAMTTDEHVSSARIDLAAADLFGFKTASEAEGEKAEEVDASPAPASAWCLARGGLSAGSAAAEDRTPRRIDASGRVSPRAPPIA